MKKLIVITAFVLLGLFAITGVAAKDKNQDQDQRVFSPAMHGEKHSCSLVNQSNREIDFDITWFESDGSEKATIPLTYLPGEADEYVVTDISGVTIYCVFEWVGSRDDFVFGRCEADGSGENRVCVNVQ